jgi:phage terminase small subunit
MKKTSPLTVTSQVERFRSLKNELKPPIDLNDAELGYFKMIVPAREACSWTEHDLLIAANLAITLVQLDKANLEIAKGGLMVTNNRGTPVCNPAITAKLSLMTTVLAVNRHLGLSASQRGLSDAEQRVRNEADKAARKVINKAQGDDLLA